MKHLEDKARADGITVPLTGNNNGTFNSGVGALDVDGPDSYPQGFDCSQPDEVERRPRPQLRPPGRAGRFTRRSSRAAPSTRGAARAMTSAHS